mgnify:CR=1 FL=1
MFRSHRNCRRLRHGLSIGALVLTGLAAVLMRPASAAEAALDVQVRNVMDRPIRIECNVRPNCHTYRFGMTVAPGEAAQINAKPIRLGAAEAVLHCGVFELADEGRGAPVFPEAGPYGMNPVGILPMPEGGTRTITYVAQQPQPHFAGAE